MSVFVRIKRLKTLAHAEAYHHHRGVPTYSPDRQHPDLVAFGEAVRRLRGEKGLSQEALAFAAEIDRGYLGRVERGDSVVALLVIAKIARALGVTVEQLMGSAGL